MEIKQISRFEEYKGYTGTVEYDSENKIWHGALMYVSDFVNYEGYTLEELYKSYTDAIDDYIEVLKNIGRK